MKNKDREYFKGLAKEQIIESLARREQDGSLFSFIKAVAPDYITNGSVDSFCLCNDLELF